MSKYQRLEEITEYDYNQIIGSQDQKLAIISNQLGELKQLSQQTGSQLSIQNEQLDHLTIKIDDETNRLTHTTGRAKSLTNKIASNWFCISFIIMGLIIGVLLVVVLI
jgi:hypothetical protein